MHSIKLTKSRGFSSEIQLENITIYPSTKPKSKDVWMAKKIFFEKGWFILWVVGESDFYYVASSDHPINKYDEPFLIFSHLFYLLLKMNDELKVGTKDHFMLNQLLFGVKNYLKNNSSNVYLYSTVDSIVEKLFNQFDMGIKLNPLNLSQTKAKLSIMRFNQIQLKNSCKKQFDDFSNDFSELSKNIITQLQNMPFNKVYVSDKEHQEKEVQAGCLSMVNKDVSLSEIGIQVDTYTNQIRQLKLNCKELRKDIDKYRKEEEDKIILTTKEYADMVKSSKEGIEKAKQEGYDKYKNNFMEFVSNNQLDHKKLSQIIFVQNTVVLVEVLQVWMMKWVSKAFYLSLGISSNADGLTLCFVDFWKTVVLGNIGKLRHPLFKLLLKEWVDLVRAIQKTGYKISEDSVNICFSHFATNFMGASYYEKSMIPMFFYLLFTECRNIPVLMGLINSYQKSRVSLTKENLNRLLEDFELIFTVDKPMKILKDNRHNIKIGDNASRVFFEVS